jgi:hypothetical protein
MSNKQTTQEAAQELRNEAAKIKSSFIKEFGSTRGIAKLIIICAVLIVIIMYFT